MSDIASGLASTSNASSAPAAPTPAPSTTPAASSSAPLSMSDALQQAGYGQDESNTAPSTDPAALPVAPTREASADQPVPGADAAKGPIPFERHEAAIKNARDTGRQDAETAFQQQHGHALQFAQAWQTDPIGSLQRVVEEMRSDPTLGPQLASLAGRQLAAQRKGQAPPQPEAEPEPDLQTQDGTLLYSDKQQRKWQAWNSKQQMAQLEQRFGPALQLAKSMQQVQEADAQTQQALESYAPMVQEIRAFPGFEEHRADILKRQHELFEQAFRSGQRVNHVALLAKAYREIVPARQQAKSQQQLMASATAKAAGRDPNPAAVASAPPSAPKSMREALAQVGLG